MTLKRVLRLDPAARKFRLFRLIWNRGIVGDGAGYSSKFSVALALRAFRFARELDGWRLTIFGIDMHSQRAWGGRFA